MDIKKKKVDVEKKFDELNKERETLVESGKQIQQKLAEIETEKTRLQGEWRLLEEMEPKEEAKK